jgi:monovalent cation/hydrogen antiporter
MVLETSIICIALVLAILALVMVSQKLKVAYPMVLVIGGLVLSLIPGLPKVRVNPELVFIIFLPPLLFEAAWQTSWKDLWKWRRVIGSFAFLIVLLTSFVIAIVSSSVIPGFTLALGFLLGGIVSPPDAVSATAILKYVKVPKRVKCIVEGESLLNDASSLIVFRFALVAVASGQFVFHQAALSFVLVIVMGIVVGIAIAFIYYAIHRWLPTDANIDIILTLTAPYVMYIVAERMHFSGVLAVVSGGLLLSSKSHQFLSTTSRLAISNVWSALGFIFNGIVFMLIGLELPEIIRQLGDISLLSAIGYGVLISAVLIVLRILCTLGASVFTVFISRFITTADNRPGWRGPLILGWAGMRGVVSLASALSVPFLLSNGTAFPQRNLILFITFTVILITLVVQGITLPLLISWVNMEDPDDLLPPHELNILIRKTLARTSLAYLNEEYAELLKDNKPLQQLKFMYENEQCFSMDDDGRSKDFQRIYGQLIEKQRACLDQINNMPRIDGELVRRYHGLLDLEEEKVRMRYSDGE